jgi:hypothetical protein
VKTSVSANSPVTVSLSILKRGADGSSRPTTRAKIEAEADLDTGSSSLSVRSTGSISVGAYRFDPNGPDNFSVTQSGTSITVTRVKDSEETKETFENGKFISVSRRKLN